MTAPPGHRPAVTGRRALLAAVCTLGALGLLLSADLAGPPLGLRSAHAKTDRSGAWELGRARITSRVIGQLRAHYVDPTRLEPLVMLEAALERVEAEVPEIRVEVLREGRGGGVGPGGPRPIGAVGPAGSRSSRATAVRLTVVEATRTFAVDRVSDLYALNWKLMEIFAFIEGAMPPHAELEGLEYAAINGMLGVLDPHSAMLTPERWRELQLSQRGRFGGVGIVVGWDDGALVVRQVLPETPAAEAGMARGDRITVIGEVSTATMSLDEAVTLLRGEPGTDVVLQVARPPAPGSESITLKRREIQVSGVDAQPLGGGIGYVRVRSFQETTDADLEAALERLERTPEGLDGLILDLRDNPGGLLEKAIAVSDLFLARGTIVTTVREAGRERDERHAREAGSRPDLPLIVLVNRGSASASEIVAGALRNHDRALIVGQRTFGKGSVQVLYRMEDAALKLTVAQYLTPSDVSIQGVGVTPDVAVVTLRPPVGSSFLGMDLQPAPEETGGERSLASRLTSGQTRAEQPGATVRLLEGRDVPDGPGFAADSLTTVAADLLRAALLPNRRAMLAALGGPLAALSRETGEALGESLAGLEIDWTDGPRPTRPKLAVTLSLRGSVEGPKEPEGPDFAVRAGDEVTVTVAVRNLGPQALHRVHVETDDEAGLFRGLELALGRVEAGRSVERTLRLKIPLAGDPGVDKVSVRTFLDGVEVPAARSDRLVRVLGVSTPRLAWSLAVVDSPLLGPSSAPGAPGNGDGLLQRGERARLEVVLQNLGDRPCPAPLDLTLRNLAGADAVIHLGRVQLPPLAPGARAVASFELELKSSFLGRFVDLQLQIDDGLGPANAERGRVALAVPVFPSPPAPGPSSGSAPGSSGPSSGSAPGSSGPSSGSAPGSSGRAAAGFAAVVDGPVRLHAGAHRDTSVLAMLGGGGIFEVLAETPDWLALAVPDKALVVGAVGPVGTRSIGAVGPVGTRSIGAVGPVGTRSIGARGAVKRTGWVAKAEVQRASAGAVAEGAISWQTLHEPPAVSLAPSADLVSTDRVTVSGVVAFSGKETGLIQVFRGRDKVFFQSVPAVTAAPGGVPESAASSGSAPGSSGSGLPAQPFSVIVPLEPGRNALSVVAREGDGRVTQHSFAIYRR